MFKSLFIGIWVAGVLTATTLFSSGQLASLMGGGEDAKKFGGKVETVKLDPVSVSMIRQGKVIGYLILETAFIYNAKKEIAKLPLNVIFQDAMVDMVFSDSEIDVDRLDRFDLNGFRENLKMKINKQMGMETVFDVLVQRIDYLTTDDVRDNKLRNFTE